MSYKTILVHVDESKHTDKRIGIAANIAVIEKAHLIGVATTGVSRFFYTASTSDMGAPIIIDSYLEVMRQKADAALKRFENIAQQTGVTSYECRLADDDAPGGIGLQARYCDLTVVGQYDPAESSSLVNADLPEYVVLNSGRPVLVVPYANSDAHSGTIKSIGKIGKRVLIGWNASIEATHAIRDAMPFLKRADIVEVAVFNPAQPLDAHGQQPGADIALYLARHGIKADVIQQEADGDIGKALLALASQLGSDLLVMGCYGHSRFREILLGGTTRTILRSGMPSVLMSH